MSLLDKVRRLVPPSIDARLAKARRDARRRRVKDLPPLTRRRFRQILSEELGLVHGDVVYIGSSVSDLSIDFPVPEILDLLRDAIGPQGTMLFPNYPNKRPVSSHQWILNGNVFDRRHTPSFTGALTELARQHPDSVRSLHPTKSVCAIGPLARDLTDGHHLLEYPYDAGSPYRNVIDAGGKVIGLGIWTEYMTHVYTADDALKDNPPVETYYPEAFETTCIDYDGSEVLVRTRAHNMDKVIHDLPPFFKKFVPHDVCEDMVIDGMRFLRADSVKLFETLVRLAKQGITIYPRELYSKRFLATLKS